MKTATMPDLAPPLPQRFLEQAIQALERIPNDLIAVIARQTYTRHRSGG